MKTISDKYSCTTIAFICILACWLVPSSIWASVEVDGIYYDLNTSAKTAAVASNPNYYTGAIDIPSSFIYNGSTYNVKSIGSCAFLSCGDMTSINFPSSVTSIGSSAFERCTGLTDVVIGNGVTSIDYEAFKNCSSLSSLTLPSSLKTIENETFSGCTSLSEIIAKRTTPPTIVSTTFDGVDKTACMVYVPEDCQSTYANATNWKAFTNIVERTVVAHDGCGDNVTYTIYSDMTMVISGTGNMDMLLFADYPTYDDYCHSIKKVIIEEGVTGIGPLAFNECTGMISVTIPSSVNEIFSTPFAGSISLTTMTVASGNTTYDSRDNCNAIIETSTNTLIAGCKNSIIPNSVTSIGDGAFNSLTGLTSVTIPNSVTSIGKNAFNHCTGLTSVAVEGETPASVGKGAFSYVNKTNCILYVPIGSKTAYESAEGWSEFENIVEYFSPDGLDILATGPCGDNGDNVTYTIYSDMTMVISGTGAINCVENGSVVHINNDYYQSIKKVIIQDGVTTIGQYAFYNFYSLTSVTIPNSVTSIEPVAFEYCTSLTSVTIPNGVTYIGGLAFYGCSNLTSVTIGAGLSSIGYMHPFCNCTSISSISVDPGNTKYDSRNNSNAIIETSTNILIIGCKNTIIPSNVTSIGYEAFYDCLGLTSISIPSSVTSIGDEAFSGCSGLTSISIPSSVTSIGAYAFSGCSGLTSISIPYRVNYIGDGVFCGCANLSWISVGSSNSYYDSRDNCNAIIETSTNNLVAGCKNTVIPNSVTSIGNSAFYDCDGLTSVMIPNNVTSIGNSAFYDCDGLTSVTIPNNVTSIGNSAFADCYNLASVSIGNSVATIGRYAFAYCYNLDSVMIPNSVTTIGDYAFNYCWKMTSATIPSSVTSIGDYAFADCSGLTSVIEENTTPIAISYKVFNNVDKTACTLYVPIGSKTAYESASYWNDFQNIVEYGLGPGTDISDLDNVIYVEQVEGRIGGTMNIPVRLKNFYGVRGFQFTMELPEGTSINSWSLSTNRLPTGATLSDKIATQKIEGNKITVACSLNYGDATFTGNDGEIATVNVTFDDEMEVGTYPIYLTACDVTTASGVDEDLSDVTATLVLEDYVVGDANGDGKIRIGDATTILNYIVGTTSDNFKEKAADANGDGKIRIGDATTILNIIVNQ